MVLENNKIFVAAFNEYLRQKAPEGEACCDNLVGIERILSKFADRERYRVNFHWGNSFIEFYGCSLNGDTLEIMSGGGPKVVKPTLLETFYFGNKQNLSFMRLGYEGLEPSSVDDDDITEEELPALDLQEYVRIGKKLHPRSVLDQGFLDYDDSGREIPLPEDKELVVRFLTPGHFMITSYGSFVNSSRLNQMRISLEEKGRDSDYYQQMREFDSQ